MTLFWDRSARMSWVLLLWTLFSGVIESPLVTTPAAMAQDEEAVEEEAPKAKKKGAKTEDAKETKKHEVSFVWWVIETSGVIGLFLFALMGYFLATSTKLFLELQPQLAMPPDLMEDIKQKMEKKDYKGVYSSIKEKDCLFTRLTSAGLAELSGGLSEARDAMERVGEVERALDDKKISMLAVLGTLGPMIGLLGTLKGMIASFSVIATSDTQLKASEVAGGISEALLVTFEGVLLSVPAIYFYAIFKNRTTMICANTTLAADEFVRKLASAAKAASAPRAAPPKPAPAAG